jgi:NitT/TauT family transport system permease protein
MSGVTAGTDARIVWHAASDPTASRIGLGRRQRDLIVSILSPISVLLAWEALVRLGLLDARFFPAPTSIVGTFWTLVMSGELWRHLLATLTRIAVGFLMGAVPALVLGLGLGLSPIARAFATPIVYALYPIPKVAILPLIMLIFGLGEMSKYVIIAIAVFFLVLVNTMSGVLLIDRIYFDVSKNFSASRRDLYLKVVLPGAMPLIFTGLKLGIGVALIVLVTSEFIGARTGLGVLIFESWQVFAIERLFVGLVVVSFVGYVVSLAFEELERYLIPWRADR